jgi:hypothetical protein
MFGPRTDCLRDSAGVGRVTTPIVRASRRSGPRQCRDGIGQRHTIVPGAVEEEPRTVSPSAPTYFPAPATGHDAEDGRERHRDGGRPAGGDAVARRQNWLP